MTWGQVVFGGAIIAGLLAAALGFGAHQVMALRRLREDAALPEDERAFERAKAWRRLAGCVLLGVMAALLAVQLVYWEAPAQVLADQQDGRGLPLTDAEKQFVRIWGGTWVAILVQLFVLVMLTAYDQLLIRSRVWREMRRLQADRRAMITRQADRMRGERRE